MLDLSKKYMTLGGRAVTHLTYEPFNSAGEKVSYPIKGSIMPPAGKRIPPTYAIWSEDGITDLVCGKHRNLDLIPAEVIQSPACQQHDNKSAQLDTDCGCKDVM